MAQQHSDGLVNRLDLVAWRRVDAYIIPLPHNGSYISQSPADLSVWEGPLAQVECGGQCIP